MSGRPYDVDDHSENHPHRGNQHYLRDDLNTRLHQCDIRDRLNNCQAKQTHTEEVRVERPSLINYQIEELQRQLEEL